MTTTIAAPGSSRRLQKDGKPLDVIAKQTGHRSLTTLMGYIRRAVELDADREGGSLLYELTK